MINNKDTESTGAVHTHTHTHNGNLVNKKIRKIIMRSCYPQEENYSDFEVLKNDYIWTNSGNTLFPYAIKRLLSTDEVEITGYRRITPKDADYINENYDCFLIPLANAFRESFMNPLRTLTELVVKLNIPCIVIGVGLQAEVSPDENNKYIFDDVVKDFCKAVLEKSHSIGVRGEITKKYLINLGFEENRINVIGCPSMYMNGREFKIRKEKQLKKDAIITMNDGYQKVPELIPKKLFKEIKENFKNYYYIPQEIRELEFLYAGRNLENTQTVFPRLVTDEEYLNDRFRMFINVPSWINFMKKVDFSIGCRIHGNVAAILAGTPAITLAPDSRVQELAEFHGIPYILAKDYTEDMSIFDLYKMADFSKFYEVHPRNFDNFVSFLDDNGLDNIYKHDGISKFDEIVKNTDWNGPVKSLFSVDKEEAAKRISLYNSMLYERMNNLKEKINALKKENQGLNNQIAKLNDNKQKQAEIIQNQKDKIKEQKRILNYKSVKLGRKIHDVLYKIKGKQKEK